MLMCGKACVDFSAVGLFCFGVEQMRLALLSQL